MAFLVSFVIFDFQQVNYFAMPNPILELEELKLTSKAKHFLRETAKWCFFLSILGFIGIGFLIILAVFSTTIFSTMQQLQPELYPNGLGIILTVVYLIFALLYFFPVYYLLQFSNKLKKALQTKSDDVLEKAFEMLKSHYKFIGVFAIITLSLYVLLILAAITGAIT